MSIKEKLANQIYASKYRTNDFDLAKRGVFFTILKLHPKLETTVNILEVLKPPLTQAIDRFSTETIPQERQITNSHQKQLHNCLDNALRFIDETCTRNNNKRSTKNIPYS